MTTSGIPTGDTVAMECADVAVAFDGYRTRSLSAILTAQVGDHLGGCRACRHAWKRFRWDAARGTELYEQLAAYLGHDFEPYFDSTRALEIDWERANPVTSEDIGQFYRSTPAYLYNQVIWHASGARPDYVTAALPILQAHAAPVLDWGCGIGVDLLRMNHFGLDVWGCDLPSPPRDFLQWRAAQGGYHRPILGPGSRPRDASVLWIIDTLDHIRDPEAELGNLLDHADMVITERYEVDQRRGRHGFHFRRTPAEIDQLLARHGLQPGEPSETPEALSIWTRARSRRPQPSRPEPVDGAAQPSASEDPHLSGAAWPPSRTVPTPTKEEC